MIELICPSKGRPEKLKRMIESARDTVSNTVSLHITVGVLASEYQLYKSHLAGLDTIIGLHIVRDWSTAYSWNWLADIRMGNAGSGNLFMLASDDMIFSTPLWDKALTDHYNSLENKVHVYALRDSRDVMGTPHPIVTREYIETMGYFLPPIFLHWYVDSWTIEMAKHNDVFTHLNEYMLIHDKPSDKGQPDATHTGIRQQGWLERDKFVNDTCQHLLQHEKERLGLAMHGVYTVLTGGHILRALNHG